jgi:hypothetical protein
LGFPQGAFEDQFVGQVGLVGAQPFNRREEFKVQALRRDIDMSHFKTEYFRAKPSTDMLAAELEKFWEPLRVEFCPRRMAEAAKAVLMLEGDASVPFQPPTLEKCVEIVRSMDQGSTNAGADAPGKSHREYLLELGDGDIEMGIEKAARVTLECYERASRGDTEDMESFWHWSVQGKRDGYKLKKLHQGRSIQAPCFTLKALWKACFKESDAAWITRDWMMRSGFDYDKPVPNHLVREYKRALAVLSLDESGFDRRMPKEFMDFFFKLYMPYVCPGVPVALMEALRDCTTNGFLVLTDGRVFRKERGNPSGFPNTLRLNCVVQLFAWAYALTYKLGDAQEIVSFLRQDVFLEICGDDSRVHCKTERGCAILGAHDGFGSWLQVWREHLPWEVKIEGMVIHKHDSNGFSTPFAERALMCPPFIGRNMVVVDGYLWTPLYNANRVLRRVLHVEPARTPEMEEELRGSMFTTLRLQTYWHVTGKVYNPVVAGMLLNGWLTPEVWRIVCNVVSEAYRDAALWVHPC